MADKDPADDGPSLELPSFGFGRKKRRDRAEGSPPEVPATADPGPEATPGSAPEVPASPDPGPEVVPATAPEVPADCIVALICPYAAMAAAQFDEPVDCAALTADRVHRQLMRMGALARRRRPGRLMLRSSHPVRAQASLPKRPAPR